MCLDPITAGTAIAASGAGKDLGDNVRRTFGIQTQGERKDKARLDREATLAQDKLKYRHELSMADRGYARTGDYEPIEPASTAASSETDASAKTGRQKEYLDTWRGTSTKTNRHKLTA